MGIETQGPFKILGVFFFLSERLPLFVLDVRPF